MTLFHCPMADGRCEEEDSSQVLTSGGKFECGFWQSHREEDIIIGKGSAKADREGSC